MGFENVEQSGPWHAEGSSHLLAGPAYLTNRTPTKLMLLFSKNAALTGTARRNSAPSSARTVLGASAGAMLAACAEPCLATTSHSLA